MTMVESIARALYAVHNEWDGFDGMPDDFDSREQQVRDHFYNLAKTALTTMREPSKEMREVQVPSIVTPGETDPFVQFYRDLIDAALTAVPK